MHAFRLKYARREVRLLPSHKRVGPDVSEPFGEAPSAEASTLLLAKGKAQRPYRTAEFDAASWKHNTVERMPAQLAGAYLRRGFGAGPSDQGSKPRLVSRVLGHFSHTIALA